MLDASIPKEPVRFYTIDGVRRAVEKGDTANILWVAIRDEKIIAAFVTSLVVHECVRSIKAWLIGGADMREWAQPFFETMTRHAKKNDCAVLEGVGRRGWSKIYPGLIDTGSALLVMKIA